MANHPTASSQRGFAAPPSRHEGESWITTPNETVFRCRRFSALPCMMPELLLLRRPALGDLCL